MSLSIWVNCPVRLQFQISFTFIYTSHKKKMSKIKTFLTDSQLGYVLSMLLKIWVNLSLNVLIKKVLIKKECKQCSAVFFVKYKCKNKDKHGVDLTTLNRVFQLLKCPPPKKKNKKKKTFFDGFCYTRSCFLLAVQWKFAFIFLGIPRVLPELIRWLQFAIFFVSKLDWTKTCPICNNASTIPCSTFFSVENFIRVNQLLIKYEKK